MFFISLSKSITTTTTLPSTPLSLLPQFQSKKTHLPKPFKSYPQLLFIKHQTLIALCKPSDRESSETVTETEDEWVKKLPDKKKPLYAHSLPCVEAWLRKLGFCQTGDDPAAWLVEKRDWHANLNLDVTDLYIRYLKTGPGNLEKDVERRFSYALSREDIENAILGGP